jgi:hypothetical protein
LSCLPDKLLGHHHPHNNRQNAETNDDQVIPEADKFVVPERDASAGIHSGNYTRLPYDRNIRSLRDLLSIVLLKLTLPPSMSTEERNDDDGNSPDTSGASEEDNEETQINTRQRLCNYLIDYCKRYGRRICQVDFIEKISPAILLDNHLTLSRILIEFNTYVSEFKQEDFARCYWWTWAPLIWPSIVGIEGKSCFQLLSENDQGKEFQTVWERLSLSNIFAIMTSMAFGQPPSWSSGFYSVQLVKKFLTLRELISRLEKNIEISQWNDSPITNVGISQITWEEYVSVFNRIASYLPPARERLVPIFKWVSQNKNGQTITPNLLDKIQRNGLQQELDAYQKQPKPIIGIITDPDDEGEVYCPRCGGALQGNSVSAINKGKLVLCNISSDVWLYKTENLLKQVV